MKSFVTTTLSFATLTSALLAVLQAAEPAKIAARPNIVLIVADDLGINDLGCYGRKDHQTPNLDRLAAQGLRFTCAYTAQPICSPSRAALMTGLCPARLNLTNYLPGRPHAPSQRLLQPRIEGQLPLEEVTVAELLKNVGYATGLFGKWHLGGSGFGPREQGFDVAVSPPADTPPTLQSGGKGEYAITAAAEKFIDDHRDQPFFCYVPHNNPHIPLAATPELVEEHRDAFHPVYAAMIETLDDSVGRLMAKVESLGLSDRTIFLFTSDNGGLHVLEFPGTPPTYNKPFRAGKGYVYEGGLRVPLLVRCPGVVAPGTTCETPIVLTDLVPTLLEAAGVDVAKTVGPLDGMSALKLLRGKSLSARTLYWHFPNYTNQGGRPAGAIREGDWKLVEQFEDGSVELFNLVQDKGETNNLAASEPARAEELRGKLQAWRASVGARMPTPNPEFDDKLHRRLYVEQDSSRLVAESTAAATEPHWKGWREAMNAAVKGRAPSTTPANGDIRLQAKDARIHAQTMRYELQPNKNVLGYWTNAADWADWEFEVATAGVYDVEIQQGCGKGSGGAEVAVAIGGQTLKFTVQDTGHFQHMILRDIGRVELAVGKHTLAVKPQTKPGAAVMDLRRVVLRPAPTEVVSFQTRPTSPQEQIRGLKMKTESFGRDPGWLGINNRSAQTNEARIIRQDFGFSAKTGHAGGESTGELGGFISPAGEASFYGKVIEPTTLDQPMNASGTMTIGQGGTHLLLGFFNANTVHEWRTPNTIAMRLNGRGENFFAYVEYCTSKWRAGGDTTPFPSVTDPETGRWNLIGYPCKKSFKWTLSYDPTGNDGKGVVTATIGQDRAVCNLEGSHKTDGATFNRFGIVNIVKSADSGSEVWFDDVAVNGGASETFDHDPKWDGRNNRRTMPSRIVRPWFDFGFSNTNLAHGKGPGELGGQIFRGDCREAARMACYGDRVRPLTLDKPLKASGKVVMTRGVSDSTTLFGFYNSVDSMRQNESQRDGLPESVVGIHIEGPSSEGFRFYPVLRVKGGGSKFGPVRESPSIYPDGKSHDWSMEYNPDGADGKGKIIVTLDEKPVAFDLEAGDKAHGTTFDRFGIVTSWIDGNSQDVYWDDLSYTVGQE